MKELPSEVCVCIFNTRILLHCM